MPLIWITWLWSSAISLDGHGSKIRKVNRCRPTVSNGTILVTKQEFFFTKVAPRTKHNWHCTIGLFTNIASLYFIQQYHLFFRKELIFFRMFIFQWNDIQKHHVECTTEICLIRYFKSIFTEFFLYYCCCCYCYLM